MYGSIWKIASSGIQRATANSRDFVGVKGRQTNRKLQLTLRETQETGKKQNKTKHQQNQPAPTRLNLRNTEDLWAAIETTYLQWSHFINNLPNSGVCFPIPRPHGALLGLVSAIVRKSAWPSAEIHVTCQPARSRNSSFKKAGLFMLWKACLNHLKHYRRKKK